MYLMGMLPDLEDSSSNVSESDSKCGTSVDLQCNEAVCVPRCSFTSCQQLRTELARSIGVISACNDQGKSLFCVLLPYAGTT